MTSSGTVPPRVGVLVVGSLLVALAVAGGPAAAASDPGNASSGEAGAFDGYWVGAEGGSTGDLATAPGHAEAWGQSGAVARESRASAGPEENGSAGRALDEGDLPSYPGPAVDSADEGSTGPSTVIVEASDADRLDPGTLRSLGVEVGDRHGRYVEVTASPSTVGAIRALPWVRSVRPVLPPVRSSVSEGVETINASALHDRGVTGEDVRVGVLTGGVDPTSSEYADQVFGARAFHPSGMSGDDPAHGTAVTEVVSDTAPGARLYLTAFDTPVDYADAVEWLLDRDVDVVVMSISWPGRPDDGTSLESRVAANATDEGVVWVNSAGNAGQKHWQGNFEDPDDDGWLNVDGDAETIPLNENETMPGGTLVSLSLKWTDFPGTDDDYTLYLLDEDLEVVDSSSRMGSENEPVEGLSAVLPSDGRYSVAIEGEDSPHLIEVFGLRNTGSFENPIPRGSVRAPAVATGVTAVGAYDVRDGDREPYSAAGETNDGRRGVDVLGPARVSSSVYDSFAGTSAAAPHVGGAAALLLSVDDDASRAAVETALVDGAEDVGPAGPDVYSGGGKVDVDAAADLVCGNDDLEPNDDADTAVPVSEARSADLTICAGEYDGFTVEVAPDESLSASIAFDHGTGDLDLVVFAPNGSVLASSASSTDDESVTIDRVPTPGTYHVVVTGVDGSSAPYDLSVDAGFDSLVADHATCTNVSTETGRCPDGTETDVFASDDDRAVSQVEFGSVTTNHTVSWTWYAPSGDQYHSAEVVVNEDDRNRSGVNAWSLIDLQGTEAANVTGEWTVEVAVDGTPVLEQSFVVESEGGGGDGAGFLDREVRSEVPPGGTAEVTLTAEFADVHDRASVADGFRGPVASASIEAVRIDGESASDAVLFDRAGSDSIGLALQGIEAGSTLEVVYQVEIAADAEEGATVTFTGRDGGADVTAGEVTGDFGVETVSVSGDAGPVARADRDGNGAIDTDELRLAIQGWAAGDYTTDELRQVIQAWARS